MAEISGVEGVENNPRKVNPVVRPQRLGNPPPKKPESNLISNPVPKSSDEDTTSKSEEPLDNTLGTNVDIPA